jgi:hypothetical protein
VLYGHGQLSDRLRTVLTDLPAARARVEGLAAAMARFDWSAMAPRYDAVLDEVREQHRPAWGEGGPI